MDIDFYDKIKKRYIDLRTDVENEIIKSIEGKGEYITMRYTVKVVESPTRGKCLQIYDEHTGQDSRSDFYPTETLITILMMLSNDEWHKLGDRYSFEDIKEKDLDV